MSTDGMRTPDDPIVTMGVVSSPVVHPNEWFYGPQLWPDLQSLKAARMKPQERWAGAQNINTDGRGIIPNGFRATFRAQRLLKHVDKTKLKLININKVEGPQRERRIAECQLSALNIAADHSCVPNVRSLESVLLCRFTQEVVNEDAFTLFRAHSKQMEVSLRPLDQCTRMKRMKNNRFILWTVGQKQVLCDMGEPREYSSWDSMLGAAGGLAKIIDTGSSGVTSEQEFIDHVYANSKGPGIIIGRAHVGSAVRRTLWPWWPVSGDETADIMWERLCHAADCVREVWGLLYKDDLLDKVLPHHWVGQRLPPSTWGVAQRTFAPEWPLTSASATATSAGPARKLPRLARGPATRANVEADRVSQDSTLIAASGLHLPCRRGGSAKGRLTTPRFAGRKSQTVRTVGMDGAVELMNAECLETNGESCSIQGDQGQGAVVDPIPPTPRKQKRPRPSSWTLHCDLSAEQNAKDVFYQSMQARIAASDSDEASAGEGGSKKRNPDDIVVRTLPLCSSDDDEDSAACDRVLGFGPEAKPKAMADTRDGNGE